MTGLLKKAYWTWKSASLSRAQTRSHFLDFPDPSPKHRIGWVLAGNEWLGSARVKGFLIDESLRQAEENFLSRILYHPSDGDYLHSALEWKPEHWRPFLQRLDVLCFQTRSGYTEQLLEDCRAHGVKTVFSISDLQIHKVPESVFRLSDAVVTSSPFLRDQLLPYHSQVFVIDDPLEVPAGMHRVEHDRRNQPQVVWFGHPGHWNHVEFLKDALRSPMLNGYTLKTISRHPEASVQWHPKTVWHELQDGDIAVIPCDLDQNGKAKSSNRLTALMKLGYPVVATPIPAYQPYIQHGENGYFATDRESWIQSLARLADQSLRQEIGKAARETEALREVELASVRRRWEKLFNRLLEDHCDTR